MKMVVDRIEKGLAVCEMESKEMVTFGVDQLPEGMKEGDILVKVNGTYEIAKEETKTQKKAVTERMDRLFRN